LKQNIRPYSVNGKDHDSILDKYELARAYGKWCSDIHREEPGRYATTLAVAMDMLNFIEKQAIALGKPDSEAKLWFYGGSYGIVL
jgi:hypothetical protein